MSTNKDQSPKQIVPNKQSQLNKLTAKACQSIPPHIWEEMTAKNKMDTDTYRSQTYDTVRKLLRLHSEIIAQNADIQNGNSNQ